METKTQCHPNNAYIGVILSNGERSFMYCMSRCNYEMRMRSRLPPKRSVMRGGSECIKQKKREIIEKMFNIGTWYVVAVLRLKYHK